MARITAAVFTAFLLAVNLTAFSALAADDKQTEDEFRTSKLVGSNVYNEANDKIGSIEDIVLKSDGSMDEVVLSVGGFLGIGDKYVGVPFNKLKISRNNNSFKISTDGTKDSLKALPDYHFLKH
jgi:ribosomal 30S subunit maturation factor RimM